MGDDDMPNTASEEQQPYPLTLPGFVLEFRHSFQDLSDKVEARFDSITREVREMRRVIDSHAAWIRQEQLRQEREKGRAEGRGEAVTFTWKTLGAIGAVAGGIGTLAGGLISLIVYLSS